MSNSILKTFAKFSVGTWVSAFLAIVSTPVIAWFLAPEEMGKASMFTLVYNLAVMIITLAGDQGFARHFNEYKDRGTNRLIANAIVPSLICLTIVEVVIEVFKKRVSVALFEDPGQLMNVTYLQISLIFGLFFRFLSTTIRMKGAALQYSNVQILQAVTNVFFVILYAHFHPIYTAIIFGQVTSIFAGVLLCVYYERNMLFDLFKGKSLIERQLLYTLFIYSLPFVPTFLVDWIFQGADRTFLRIYSNFGEMGLYAMATKISIGLSVIQSGFTTFWIPFAYERHSKDPNDKKFYSQLFNILTVVFIVLIGIVLLSKQLIEFILPVKYAGVISIFPFLMFTPMLYTLSEIFSVGINYSKKTILHFYIIIVSTCVNTLAAYLLIRHKGAMGAAIAMMVGYICFFSMRKWLANKYYDTEISYSRFWICLVGLMIPSVLLAIYPNGYWYLLALPAIIFTLFIYREELRNINKIL